MPSDSSRRFEPNELRRFLTAVDRHLEEPAEIIVLGGSAMAFHGVAAGTIDIDVWETDLAPLRDALRAAIDETGLAIPVNPADVGDVPYDYRDRLESVQGPWRRLSVRVLERHDLVLSKAVRAHEGDLVAIERLHAIAPLDRAVLVERYLREMRHAIGDPSRLDQNFLLVIERVYGEVEVAEVEREIARH